MGKGSDGSATASMPAPLPLKKIATMKVEQLPTKKQLKDAIPAHCFQHSIPTALALLVRDSIVNLAIFYVAWNYLPLLECNWSTPAGVEPPVRTWQTLSTRAAFRSTAVSCTPPRRAVEMSTT